MDAEYLRAAYEARFTVKERQDKRILWNALCEKVLQQYVPIDGTVLDLGAGFCEFSNAIRASRRIALDLNPETGVSAGSGVEFLQTRSDDISALSDEEVDTVFTSNFFEHLSGPEALLATLAESWRVLRPGGKIVVLMPNVRNLPGAYWDYLDHRLALTQHSLTEALVLSGFTMERVVPRFLPYTVRGSRLPVADWSVRAYLQVKPMWWLMGKQMLAVATK